MRILIVDDEVKILGLLKSYFEVHGHEAQTTPDGDAALKLIAEYKPELLLLDLSLKGKLNGKDILQEAQRLLPTIKVIVLSGLLEAQEDELTRLGASGFLRKPIQLDELGQLVENVTSPPPPSA